LLDKVVASGCPPATVMSSNFGGFDLVACDVEVDGIAWSHGPRRASPILGPSSPCDRPRLSLIRAIHSRPATDRPDIQDYSVRLG
jgi:hypothetical protein